VYELGRKKPTGTNLCMYDYYTRLIITTASEGPDAAALTTSQHTGSTYVGKTVNALVLGAGSVW